MRSVVQVIAAVLLVAACGASRPTRDPAEVRCETVTKFTTDWFLRNTKPEFSGTLQETGLFYSRGMSELARSLGQSNRDLTTIWDIWPCYLYNHHDNPSNPLRCIHADESQQLRFFENMSRAFAIKAQSFARVLHSEGDYHDPPMDGIWGRIEFPQLVSGNQVDVLQKMSETMTKYEVFWKRLEDIARHLPNLPKLDLKKRGASQQQGLGHEGASCMPMRDYAVFDKLPW